MRLDTAPVVAPAVVSASLPPQQPTFQIFEEQSVPVAVTKVVETKPSKPAVEEEERDQTINTKLALEDIERMFGDFVSLLGLLVCDVILMLGWYGHSRLRTLADMTNDRDDGVRTERNETMASVHW